MPRSALRLLLTVLALLQGITPLLHAHVMPVDGGQTGLHLHGLDLSPLRDCSGAMSVTQARGAEPAAITAPTEHRRDDSIQAHDLDACLPTLATMTSGHTGSLLPSTAQARVADLALRIPPARGPPGATSRS